MPSRMGSLALDVPLVLVWLRSENPGYQLIVVGRHPDWGLCLQGWCVMLPGCSVPGIYHLSCLNLFRPCTEIHPALYPCKSFYHDQ